MMRGIFILTFSYRLPDPYGVVPTACGWFLHLCRSSPPARLRPTEGETSAEIGSTDWILKHVFGSAEESAGRKWLHGAKVYEYASCCKWLQLAVYFYSLPQQGRLRWSSPRLKMEHGALAMPRPRLHPRRYYIEWHHRDPAPSLSRGGTKRAHSRSAGLVDWFNASFSQFERTYRTE